MVLSQMHHEDYFPACVRLYNTRSSVARYLGRAVGSYVLSFRIMYFFKGAFRRVNYCCFSWFFLIFFFVCLLADSSGMQDNLMITVFMAYASVYLPFYCNFFIGTRLKTFLKWHFHFCLIHAALQRVLSHLKECLQSSATADMLLPSHQHSLAIHRCEITQISMFLTLTFLFSLTS